MKSNNGRTNSLQEKSMHYPKISIITPSYNQGKFIAQTIDSVLKQNYPNLEYIVIDGGSTDETIDILKQYGDQIQWISEKDRGQSHAINKGMQMASGDILAFINSDDYYLDGTLHEVAKAFSKPGTLWVTGDYKIVDENNQEIHFLISRYKRFLRFFSSWQMLAVANYINQPSTFWHKDIYNIYGPFNEELHYAFDYEYWLRLIKKIPFTNLPKKLSVFRVHGLSKGGAEYVNQFNQEEVILEGLQYPRISKFLHHLHNMLIIQVYKIIK